MNIDGTYKINFEQSVRKMVEGVDATAGRLLGYVGLNLEIIPKDPRKEQQIQQLITDNQSLANSILLTISPDKIFIQSAEGEGHYPIKSRSFADNRIKFVVDIPDDEENVEWQATLFGERFLLFSEDSELGEYIWERTAP